VGELFLHL
jgi:hypothetical protein